jgi:hypothetical protein
MDFGDEWLLIPRITWIAPGILADMADFGLLSHPIREIREIPGSVFREICALDSVMSGRD